MLKFIIPYHPENLTVDADIEYTEKECIILPGNNSIKVAYQLRDYAAVRVEINGNQVMPLVNWIEAIEETKAQLLNNTCYQCSPVKPRIVRCCE